MILPFINPETNETFNKSNYDFTWNTTSFTKNNLKIKLNF